MASAPASRSASSGSAVFVPEVGSSPVPGYRLIRLRGRGGFATVWEAAGPTGERVALKFMSSANLSSTARELRSLQSVQAVEHPNLLKIRNVWSAPGCIVIGMDLADASLLDLIEVYLEELGRQPEPEKLCYYLYQAAQALDFLNARRHRIDGKLVALQHGDIKPNNILLVGDEAKLADYGLATQLQGPAAPCPRHGTAEYCAPEVFQGTLTEKSDQFSFAVTYFVLRTLRFPYPAPPADREQLRNYVRPDPDLSPLPPAEQPILARALSVIPQTRWPSCHDLMTALIAANGLEVRPQDDGRFRIAPAQLSGPASQRSQQIRLT
ncbi:MAG: protein kinase [Gemmataceae bacterium]